MEQSSSSERRCTERRCTAKRMLLASGLIIGVGLLCGALFVKSWIARQTVGISPTVRPAAEAVLRAQIWSRISGSYWENEMEDRARFISTLPERERVDFYRVILLTCKLDASRATVFSQLVARDADSLRRDLLRVKDGADFARLSAMQQKEVIAWIDELKVVAELHGASILK